MQGFSFFTCKSELSTPVIPSCSLSTYLEILPLFFSFLFFCWRTCFLFSQQTPTSFFCLSLSALSWSLFCLRRSINHCEVFLSGSWCWRHLTCRLILRAAFSLHFKQLFAKEAGWLGETKITKPVGYQDFRVSPYIFIVFLFIFNSFFTLHRM